MNSCVTGKFTDFPECVIRYIFIRKLSHLTISSPFILKNQKLHKNHSGRLEWILLITHFYCAPACRHFCHLAEQKQRNKAKKAKQSKQSRNF